MSTVLTALSRFGLPPVVLIVSLNFCRYGPSTQLRGHEDRDWLRSYSTSGLQDSASNSPFSPGSSLTSPSGTRFNFGQLGTALKHSSTNADWCDCVCVSTQSSKTCRPY